MADGLLIVDRIGQAGFVNPAAESILGVKQGELVGLQFGLPAVSGGATQLDLVRPDGGVIAVEMRVAEVDWDGEVAYLASLRDVTERERAEEALRAAEAYSKNLIDNSLDMIISVDQERRIVEFNRAAQVAFGYEKAEVVGKLVDILYAEPAEGSKVNDTTLSTGHCIAEVINVRKNGETFSSLLSASVLRDANGRMLGVMGISQDITERKQIQEKLQETSRLASIGELAAGVAHEINNPLTVVTGFSEVLMGRKIPQPEADFVQKIYSEAHRASKIVQNLLSFARKHEPEKRYMDVTAILERALELKAYDFRVSNIEVSTQWSSDLPLTMLDEHQLTQVILNILTNAEQAMLASHGNGELVISASKSEDIIRVSIADDGPGIPPENLSKLFDPFFTTKEVGEGTGLGLSICYGIVREHGGEIWAESQTGKGATFHIELPILAPEACAESVALDSESRLSPEKRILVVDDESGVRDLLFHVLSSEGHTVDLASDSHQALDRIQGDRYDCIILDLKMPGTSGQELYRLVDNADPDLARRIIFITGDTVRPEARDFLKATGNPFLGKPFDLGELRKQIQSLDTATPQKKGEYDVVAP